MAIDGLVTTWFITHFTQKKIPVLAARDSYVIRNVNEPQFIDQMALIAKAEIGAFLFKKKETVFSNMLPTFRGMDNQINVVAPKSPLTGCVAQEDA